MYLHFLLCLVGVVVTLTAGEACFGFLNTEVKPIDYSEEQRLKAYCMKSYSNDDIKSPDYDIFVHYLVETSASLKGLTLITTFIENVLLNQNHTDSGVNDVHIGLRLINLIRIAQRTKMERISMKSSVWPESNDYLVDQAIKLELSSIVDGDKANESMFDFLLSRKAMLMGANYSHLLGESELFKLTKVSHTMDMILQSHNKSGIIVDQEGNLNPNLLVALNYGYAWDGVFSPLSVEVANTVASLNAKFCSKTNLPGIVYEESNLVSTVALAGLFYRAAFTTIEGNFPLSDTLVVWQKAFNIDYEFPQSARKLAEVFANQGDAVVNRLRTHLDFDSLNRDMLWVYVEILNAMSWRDYYYNRLLI